MYQINLTSPIHEISEVVNIYGTTNINGVEKNIVCSITYEFLQDINNGSIEYSKTIDSNRFTVENMAEDKLNALLEEELQREPIRVMIISSDRFNYGWE